LLLLSQPSTSQNPFQTSRMSSSADALAHLDSLYGGKDAGRREVDGGYKKEARKRCNEAVVKNNKYSKEKSESRFDTTAIQERAEEELEKFIVDLVEKTGVSPEAVFSSKVKSRVLQLDSFSKRSASQAEQLRKERKDVLKRKRVNRTYSRKLRGEVLEELKSFGFEEALQLHALWEEYMKSVVEDGGSNQKPHLLEPKLLKSDLHGCIIKVEKARCASLQGIEGILVQETENMLRIVTPTCGLKSE